MARLEEGSSVSVLTEPPAREPLDVKFVRHVLNHWPFSRGKGVVLRCFRSFGKGRAQWFEVESGVLLPLDLGDYVIRHAFTNGYVREPEVRLSRALIRRGDTVLDVGAHVGLWVMGAAIRAGRGAEVHALEPVARTFEQLTANLKRNGLDFVQCHKSACSSTGGPTMIYAASNGNSGMASLARSEGVDVPQETAVTTLDRFCSEASLAKIHFLKVDVEGAKLQVFRGGSRLLSSLDAPAILFEVGSTMAARFGSSCRQVKALLRDYGYEVFILRRKKLEPVLTLEEHAQADLFAFKPPHFQRHPWLGALVA